MPCTLTGSIEGDRAVMSKEAITQLTQLLCGACELLEEHGVPMDRIESTVYSYGAMKDVTINLADWWTRHKKVDAESKEKEVAEEEVNDSLNSIDKLFVAAIDVLDNVVTRLQKLRNDLS